MNVVTRLSFLFRNTFELNTLHKMNEREKKSIMETVNNSFQLLERHNQLRVLLYEYQVLTLTNSVD